MKSKAEFEAIVHYECSNTQRKIRMWKKQLLQAPLDTDEASQVTEPLGEKYAEVDYRVISKLIKLALLLATSKGTSFGLANLEEAVVLHR
ncbi:uncharacterized protein ALTATR162_LOCUS8330 [Alternaria atra]|jgi:hypothetical protein|uniref:Uncharacterized protein n=1 Tax=Alternaria atra TaxID=119953 RepID=A0A8J2N2J3_9PLEO|nr:uncharacterized protein ALTATR162_LOCUS8330 [Alternaria atra]CAG5177667.1 unnamed protein product [Alternaria atra]